MHLLGMLDLSPSDLQFAQQIKSALIRADGSKTRAAELLGCTKAALHQDIRRLGLVHWRTDSEPDLLVQVRQQYPDAKRRRK